MKEISQPLPDCTTNNQAELMATIVALEALKERCDVTLYTDSSYVKNGITTWMSGWKKKGWKTKVGHPVKNVELWQELDRLNNKQDVSWNWVKGHSGDKWNTLADELAVKASASLKEGV